MCTKKSDGPGRKLSIGAAACVGALAVLGAYGAGGSARQVSVAVEPAQTQPVALRGVDLEKAFWICDYTATEKGVSATPVDVCSQVTEDLKNGKFDGDFDELVKWWNQNKIAEHRILAEQGR